MGIQQEGERRDRQRVDNLSLGSPEQRAQRLQAALAGFVATRLTPLESACLTDNREDRATCVPRRTSYDVAQDEIDYAALFAFLRTFDDKTCFPVSSGVDPSETQFSVKFRRFNDPYLLPEHTGYQIMNGIAAKDPSTGLPVHQVNLHIGIQIAEHLESRGQAVTADSLTGNDPDWVLRKILRNISAYSLIARIDRAFAVKDAPGQNSRLEKIFKINRAGILQHFELIDKNTGTIRTRRTRYANVGRGSKMFPAKDDFQETEDVAISEYVNAVSVIIQYAKLINEFGARTVCPH